MSELIKRTARACREAGCEHSEDEVEGFLLDLYESADRDPRVAILVKAVLTAATTARSKRLADERWRRGR